MNACGAFWWSWKRKAKRYRLFEKARQMLSQETDVLNLIKNVRAIHRTMEIKIKLTKEEEQYIEKSRYKRI